MTEHQVLKSLGRVMAFETVLNKAEHALSELRKDAIPELEELCNTIDPILTTWVGELHRFRQALVKELA